MSDDIRRPAAYPHWSDVIEWEMRQTHCVLCGDAIVREGERYRHPSWPDRVICADCLPLAEAHLADVATLEAADMPLVERSALAAVLALTAGAIVIASLALMVASLWR